MYLSIFGRNFTRFENLFMCKVRHCVEIGKVSNVWRFRMYIYAKKSACKCSLISVAQLTCDYDVTLHTANITYSHTLRSLDHHQRRISGVFSCKT
jgi:hypothetical protein